jgi:HK97 gp10 family phage protein
MAQAPKTRLVWDRAAVKALRTDHGVHQLIKQTGDVVASQMQALAPKHTGRGSESIRDKWAKSQDSGAIDIGWDAAHWYMIFPEYGTKFQAQQRFARGVLDKFTI